MFTNQRFCIILCLFVMMWLLPAVVLPQSGTAAIGAQLELKVGAGMYNPSFTNWNDGINQLDATMAGLNYQREGSVHTLAGNTLYQFEIKYHINSVWSLGLCISHFETDASTVYTRQTTERLNFWPNFHLNQELEREFTQEIRINPTMLTVSMAIPWSPKRDMVDLYVGGGIGYLFSRIKNSMDVGNSITLHSAVGSYADTTINLVHQLLAHTSTNVNPLAYQATVGVNVKFGIATINLEAGYQFARAEINTGNWKFFTQKDQTDWHRFSVKDDAQGAFKTNWYKTFVEKEFFMNSPTYLDDVSIDKLQLDGFIFRAQVGFAF